MNEGSTALVDVQVASAAAQIPAASDIASWARTVLAAHEPNAQLCVRIVDEAEMVELNEAYRHGQGATNVLSFPFAAPVHTDPPLLGDIVICVPVVAREAEDQGKTMRAHFAHMVVHGTLHLLGYDHITAEDAQKMEPLEINVLVGLGFANPYGGGLADE